jgi:hypothetical protein
VVDVSAVVLTVLNLMFWVGILFNLPGTWLMVLVTAVLKWWLPAYKNVLVCERFWYFGSAAPSLPEALTVLVKRGPGHRCEDSPALIAALVSWLGTFTPGVSGVPFMDTKSPRQSIEGCHKQHTSPLPRAVAEK